MAVHSPVMSILTTIILLGTVSSGLPVPQNLPVEISPTADETQVHQPNGLPVPLNSPVEISPNVDATQVQQPNGVLMSEALQQPQRDETNTGMTSDSQLMMAAPQQATPLVEVPTVETPVVEVPTVETPVVEATPVVETPLSPPQVETSMASPAVPQPEVQQPAAAERSRPDCPEMEAKHFIICEGDDKKDDHFQFFPEAKVTQPSPQVVENTQ